MICKFFMFISVHYSADISQALSNLSISLSCYDNRNFSFSRCVSRRPLVEVEATHGALQCSKVPVAYFAI